MTVFGHVLPQRLVALLAAKQWPPASPDRTALAAWIADVQDLTFLDVDGMARSTGELEGAAQGGGGAWMALTDGVAMPGHLDVKRAVAIGMTYGQEVVALDYAGGGAPRVVATQEVALPEGRKAIRWSEVDPTFEAFAKRIGL
ncbi:MAG: hypothetical protein R3F59_03065 [Myxococcota bacterium]